MPRTDTAPRHNSKAKRHLGQAWTLLVCLSFMLSFIAAASGSLFAKNNAKKTKVSLKAINQIHIAPDGEQLLNPPRLQASVPCVARLDSGAFWAVSEWVIGAELYKSYQDPTQVCQGEYPYIITEAHMFLQISTAATITVAIDIEAVDLEYMPGCPVPGEMLFLGDLTAISFPSAGLFDVIIELSQPIEVNEPFFLGFFFSSSISPLWELSLVTDDYRETCVSFNIWDTTLGYIDLGDPLAVHQSVYPETDPCYNSGASSSCFQFDGRIILHTAGTLSDATGCCNVPGDANNDEKINITDVTYLIAYAFSGGSIPACMDEADANGDGRVNIVDVTYLIAHYFTGGPAPICGTTGQ